MTSSLRSRRRTAPHSARHEHIPGQHDERLRHASARSRIVPRSGCTHTTRQEHTMTQPTAATTLSAFVWKHRDGVRVTQRRRYTTLAGVTRFARRVSSEPDVLRVTITDDTDVATMTDPITGKPMIGDTVATFKRGDCTTTTMPAMRDTHDTGDTDMTKNTNATKDTGSDVTTTKAGKRAKAKADRPMLAKVPRKAKAISVVDALGMTDGAILKLDPMLRPDLLPVIEDANVAKVTAKFPYAVSYVRFLHGERAHFPQARMAGLSADDARVIRDAVRLGLAKASGLKKAPEVGRVVTPKAKAAPKPAAPKKATAAKPKPAAKKATAKKVTTKPKPAAAKKVTAKDAAAPKAAAPKAAAARRRGASVTVKVTKRRK